VDIDPQFPYNLAQRERRPQGMGRYRQKPHPTAFRP